MKVEAAYGFREGLQTLTFIAEWDELLWGNLE